MPIVTTAERTTTGPPTMSTTTKPMTGLQDDQNTGAISTLTGKNSSKTPAFQNSDYFIYFYSILLASSFIEQWNNRQGATTALSQLQWSQSLKDM